MTAEPLDPHALARLLLDAAPHMELIERVAPHLPSLRPMLSMLDKWGEVDKDLKWAGQAPEHLRATAHQAVFMALAKTHGGSAALWGALGHEMLQRAPKPTEDKPERNKGGRKVTVRTPEEWAQMRERLVKAGQLVARSRQESKALSKLLLDQCDVTMSANRIGALRSGRFLRELDHHTWPDLSIKVLEVVIAALELLNSSVHIPNARAV